MAEPPDSEGGRRVIHAVEEKLRPKALETLQAERLRATVPRPTSGSPSTERLLMRPAWIPWTSAAFPSSGTYRSRTSPTCAGTIPSACSPWSARSCGGSTPRPARGGVRPSPRTRRVTSPSGRRCLVLAGARPGDLLHHAYGYGLFTGGLGLHQGAERLGLTVVPASGGATARQARLILDFGADGIACSPSCLLSVADALDAAGTRREDLRLRYGVLGAEPWTEAMRAQIERRLGMDAVDIYGLSEAIGPGVACECREERNGLHVMEDHFLVEVVDPGSGRPLPDGETGELVVTSLTKEAFPVLRYRTGDLASLDRSPCSCGRTFVRMSRVKGRTDDMLIIRGVYVFPSEIEAVLLGHEGLARHDLIRVHRVRHFDVPKVQVECCRRSPGWTNRAARALSEDLRWAIRDEIGLHARVILLRPGSLPRSEGKAVRVEDLRRE